MSSLRTWSPKDLLYNVQKIKVCMYDTKTSDTVIPEGEGFYINRASAILDMVLKDLEVDVPAKTNSKMNDIQAKLSSIESGLFGKSEVHVEDPTLQDIILKTENIYNKLYKTEGNGCAIS